MYVCNLHCTRLQEHPRIGRSSFLQYPNLGGKMFFLRMKTRMYVAGGPASPVLLCFWQVCKLSYTLLFVSNVTLATERGRERGRGIPHVLLPSNLILRQPLLSFQLFIFYSKHWHDYLICSIFKFLIIYYLKLYIVLEFKLGWKENC